MLPEQTVQHLAQIVSTSPQFTEDDVYAALATAGIPAREADLAYKFTQAAWGRVFLQGMGIKHSDEYFCLDSNGDVLSSGNLSIEPHFVAATNLAKDFGLQPGLRRLAVMSADVQTVNQALHAGSQAENLATAPLVFFLEPPTDAGMDSARRLITEFFSRPKQNAAGESHSLAPSSPPTETLPRINEPVKQSWFKRLFRRDS